MPPTHAAATVLGTHATAGHAWLTHASGPGWPPGGAGHASGQPTLPPHPSETSPQPVGHAVAADWGTHGLGSPALTIHVPSTHVWPPGHAPAKGPHVMAVPQPLSCLPQTTPPM